MALNNIQSRIERSLFEAIRKSLVAEGYIPDVSDDIRYPKLNGQLTKVAQQNWDSDMSEIKDIQSFAAEVFGHSSSQAKGLKRTPRISIIPRRIIPGDLGFNPGYTVGLSPLDPNNYINVPNPPESSNFQLDIMLASSTADQDRFLHAILSKVFAQKKYIEFYDDPRERFFLRQLNFYDLPNDTEGIEEKVYTYEITDLYLFDNSLSTPVSLIKEITVNTTLVELQLLLAQNLTIIGPYVNDGNFHIDLSGIKIN